MNDVTETKPTMTQAEMFARWHAKWDKHVGAMVLVRLKMAYGPPIEVPMKLIGVKYGYGKLWTVVEGASGDVRNTTEDQVRLMDCRESEAVK